MASARQEIPRCPGCGGSRQAFHEDYDTVRNVPIYIHDDNGCELCDEQGRSWGGVLVGDVLERLAGLSPRSVSCVVTSPPYWSLRKYDAPDVVWGGDPACDHGELPSGNKNPLRSGGDGAAGSTLEGGKRTQMAQREAVQGVEGGYKDSRRWQHEGVSRQETPDAWVRPDTSAPVPPAKRRCKKCHKFGVTIWTRNETVAVWCEDCQHETFFAGVQSRELRTFDGAKGGITELDGDVLPVQQGATCSRCGAWRGQFGLEPTRELYIEHSMMVLRALRRVLRKDGVVWWNIAGGYLSGQSGHAGSHGLDGGEPQGSQQRGRTSALAPKQMDLMPFRVALAAQADGWWVRSVVIWSKPNAMPESTKDRPTTAHEYVLLLTKSARYWYDAEAIREPHTAGHLQQHLAPNKDRGESRQFAKQGLHDFLNPNGRNCRSVWTFPTAQTPEAHFATFPPELPRRCIEAATPREVCHKCGLARVRLVEQGFTSHVSGIPDSQPADAMAGRLAALRDSARAAGEEYINTTRTLGWSDCPCDEPDYQPGIVLDPFGGTGTSLWVARQLGRRYIGIELSEAYAEMARTKLQKWWDPPTVKAREVPEGQATLPLAPAEAGDGAQGALPQ